MNGGKIMVKVKYALNLYDIVENAHTNTIEVVNMSHLKAGWHEPITFVQKNVAGDEVQRQLVWEFIVATDKKKFLQGLNQLAYEMLGDELKYQSLISGDGMYDKALKEFLDIDR